MVATSQYPQYIYTLNTGGDAVQDENGSWVQGGGQGWVLNSICREETNGKGTIIKSEDGQTIAFSSLINLPKNSCPVPSGTEIMVTRELVWNSDNLSVNDFVERIKASGMVVIMGTCLKFDQGRLHNRLWV